jgi:hypothetical protein
MSEKKKTTKKTKDELSDNIEKKKPKDETKDEKKKTIQKRTVGDPNATPEEKKDLAIRFYNALLEKMGKGPIQELEEVQNIDREELIKEQNLEIIRIFENEIYDKLGRIRGRYYNRSMNDSHLLRLMRALCRENNYTLITQKSMNVKMKKTTYTAIKNK